MSFVSRAVIAPVSCRTSLSSTLRFPNAASSTSLRQQHRASFSTISHNYAATTQHRNIHHRSSRVNLPHINCNYRIQPKSFNQILNPINCIKNKTCRRSFATSVPSGAGILIVADHNNKTLHESTANVIYAASQLKLQHITVLICGHNCKSVAEQASKLSNVTRVLHSDCASLEHIVAERVTDVLLELQKRDSYAFILAPATANGKNVMPRLAAQLDVQPITDVIQINSQTEFKRPIYAGNVIATVQVEQGTQSLQILTVRPTNFNRVNQNDAAAAPIESFPVPAAAKEMRISWINDEISVSSRPALTAAKTVVSGGRGLKSKEGFELLEKLCDVLPNSAIGASRAAVDAGYIGNDYQIGQTGKVVAPQLYIACGISGAIQHLAGMKDSKCIVSINKDAEAPINQISDYYLTADIFKAVPELIEKIKAK
jgi:electron transfer flavoprotein alpha subunit